MLYYATHLLERVFIPSNLIIKYYLVLIKCFATPSSLAHFYNDGFMGSVTHQLCVCNLYQSNSSSHGTRRRYRSLLEWRDEERLLFVAISCANYEMLLSQIGLWRDAKRRLSRWLRPHIAP